MNINQTVRNIFLPLFIQCGVALVLACVSVTAAAQALPTYPIAAVASATAWGPDRFPPAAFVNAGTFQGRNNVLRIGISAADADGLRPGFAGVFYNTQGRVILRNSLNSGTSWSGSVYIPAAWATSNPGDALLNRRTDVWATLSPAVGGDTCPASACNLFPIIGFTNASATTPLTNGGIARYRVFDVALGVWNNIAIPVQYDTWTEFGITYTGTSIEFRIDGALVYTQTDLTQDDATFGPPARIGNIFFQGYNFGTTYDIYWSRAAAGTGSVPVVLAAAFPDPVFALTVTPVVVNNGFSSVGSISPSMPFTVNSGTQARINVVTPFRYIAKNGGTCAARLVGATPFVPIGSGSTQLVTDPLFGSCTAQITFVPTIPKVAVFSPANAAAGAPQNALLTFKAVITGATNMDGTVMFFADGVALPNCLAQTIVQSYFAYDEQERAATCTTTLENLAVGQHIITALYSGNVHNFPAASSSLNYAVELPRFIVTPLLITAANGAMGTVTPNTAQSIQINKHAEFKVMAPPKHIATIAGSTCVVGLEGNTALTPIGAGNTIAYTDPIKADCTVRISFVPIQPLLTVTVASTAKVGTTTRMAAGITQGASAGGTVAFFDNGAPITACTAQPIITTFTADLSVRTATCDWLPTQSGARNVSAQYAGDTFNFGAVSAGVVVQVAP